MRRLGVSTSHGNVTLWLWVPGLRSRLDGACAPQGARVPGTTRVRIPAARFRVRVLHILVAPSNTEGAGNAGCTPHPLPRVQTKETHAGQHRYAEITPALPAQWLYGLLRALPGVPGFLATIACAACRTEGRHRQIRKLDSSIGEPEPHGLTVRVAPHVLRPDASIATRLTSGDEWPSRPPCRGGLASLNHKLRLSER